MTQLTNMLFLENIPHSHIFPPGLLAFLPLADSFLSNLGLRLRFTMVRSGMRRGEDCSGRDQSRIVGGGGLSEELSQLGLPLGFPNF